jgi:hypothetical protein
MEGAANLDGVLYRENGLNTSSCNSAAQWFKQLYNPPPQDTRFWTPGDLGSPVFLFNGTIYYRGAMTLEGLA